MCSRCHEKRVAVICNDCTKEKKWCIFCDRVVHIVHPLHDRKTWRDGAHISLLPTESVDETGEIKEGSKYQWKNKVNSFVMKLDAFFLVLAAVYRTIMEIRSIEPFNAIPATTIRGVFICIY